MAFHILIVNESPEVVELLGDIFAEEGVDVALDSVDGSRLTGGTSRVPDLVLLGGTFEAGGRGRAVLRALAQATPLAGVPLVLCTTLPGWLGELRPQLDARGVSVLAKPFEIDELLRVVQQALPQAA